MKIDVILISCSRDCKLQDITQHAITTAQTTEKGNEVNCIVVETCKDYKYKGAETHLYNVPFNYNRCVNFGLSKSTADYILVGNNDLVFHKGWATELVSQMQANNLLSASPFCNNSMKRTGKGVLFGYEIRKHVAGWAIMIHRSVLDKIVKFDESVDFWFSDNVYAEQLKEAGINHALIETARVDHLNGGSTTLKKSDNKHGLTWGQKDRFYKFKGRNKCKFSVVMPVRLKPYQGAATDREAKFIRAVDSVVNQSFQDWELIIVADGCKKAVEIYKERYGRNKKIRCLEVNEQKLFSGSIRQAGLEHSFGEWIIYLDSDDMYGVNHLKHVSQNLGADWVYFDNFLKDGYVKTTVLSKKPEGGQITTSCVAHKRSLNVNWNGCDGYQHDIQFIRKLLPYKVGRVLGAEYYVCHVPGSYEY